MNRLILACQFPVDEEKVRKNLTVKERDRGFQNISLALCFLFGLEMHLCHRLDANISLIRAACGKEQDSIAHIVHVIDHIALVCLLHNMGNKIHIRLRVGADFLGKCLFDQYPQMPFVLDLLCNGRPLLMEATEISLHFDSFLRSEDFPVNTLTSMFSS